MTIQRPNLVIFSPDQWRGDVLGHVGHPAAVTPNLDRLAESDGVSFRHTFCQNPVCTPSRCSFMSGWYPHVRGHRTMFHMMHEDEPVLLKTLKDYGYFVWWGGKNDLTPGQNPVDAYCHVRHKVSDRVRPTRNKHRATDWRGDPDGDNYYSFFAGKIDTGGEEVSWDNDWDHVEAAIELLRQGPPEPFCIYLPLGSPHPPYAVEDPWYSLIDRGKVPPRAPTPEGWAGKPAMLRGIAERQRLGTWTEDRWIELRATYYGMCARMDHLFGRLMDALRDTEVYDGTAVFMFSDHGDFTGDYGLVEKNQNTFEDCLTRVPFLIKPPAAVSVRPGVRDALVELIDFPATVEALTGIPPGHTHFGRSLLPLIAGETDEHRDAVFCEGGRLHGETHCMELESTGSQVPTGLYWPRLSFQAGEGPEHTKATMCRMRDFKYVRRLYEPDELYDLGADPQELVNRADDPALADVLARLTDRMLTFYQETCDVVPHQTDKR
jgi:arylsulfatase A-like enzyme